MLKQKGYDWKDSNLANFGSDQERKVKKASAESEPAWKGAGSGVGLQVWRIVKFKVTHWPKEQYGEFYNGDSYIVLNTYKLPDEDELQHDVHFWIGKYSTQDEYGTAAYKTVELDTFLDDKPIQHREVQGFESDLFKSYFSSLQLLKGGAETGFRHVLPEKYEPRLFIVQKQEDSKRIICSQITMKRGNLNSGDVFILDAGDTIYQFNGSECSPSEKYRGGQEVSRMKSQRSARVAIETLEEDAVPPGHPFFGYLKDGTKKKRQAPKPPNREMFRLTDRNGALTMNLLAGGISKSKLTSDDVYIVNTGSHVFCWVGKEASIDERRNGLTYAHKYLQQTDTPFLPVSVVSEGRENEHFKKAF